MDAQSTKEGDKFCPDCGYCNSSDANVKIVGIMTCVQIVK